MSANEQERKRAEELAQYTSKLPPSYLHQAIALHKYTGGTIGNLCIKEPVIDKKGKRLNVLTFPEKPVTQSTEPTTFFEVPTENKSLAPIPICAQTAPTPDTAFMDCEDGSLLDMHWFRQLAEQYADLLDEQLAQRLNPTPATTHIASSDSVKNQHTFIKEFDQAVIRVQQIAQRTPAAAVMTPERFAWLHQQEPHHLWGAYDTNSLPVVSLAGAFRVPVYLSTHIHKTFGSDNVVLLCPDLLKLYVEYEHQFDCALDQDKRIIFSAQGSYFFTSSNYCGAVGLLKFV